MRNNMKAALLASTGLLMAGTAAHADTFVNGGFEAGDISGWSQMGGYRGNVYNNNLSAATLQYVDGGRGAITSIGDIDPNVGAAFGSTVYNGAHAYRVEDTTTGGYATVLTQEVKNYSDPNIYFAWKSVLEGAHGTLDAATMIISLKDLTTNTELIHREYNASTQGGGGGSIFSTNGHFYYTPDWQIEQLAIGTGLAGHDFLLSILGSDCQPTGHTGYVYVDGFGAVAPPAGNGVPEPATWAMMLVGFGAIGATLRSSRRKVLSAAA